MQFTDILMTFILLVGTLVLAPTIYYFVQEATNELGTFSSILLGLAPPFLIIALIISAAVSARGGGV
jgi:hypothetical protein